MTFKELCDHAASELNEDDFTEKLEEFISGAFSDEFNLLRHILIRCATE